MLACLEIFHSGTNAEIVCLDYICVAVHIYILTVSVPLPQKCQRIRIRKDAHKLTQVEKRQLQDAMNGIIQDGTFKEIANYHGAPYGEKCQLRYTHYGSKMGCCKHHFEGASYEDFWSWHRLYMGK